MAPRARSRSYPYEQLYLNVGKWAKEIGSQRRQLIMGASGDGSDSLSIEFGKRIFFILLLIFCDKK
jgi:hypothetical protein